MTSLKAFHILFIVASLILLAFVAWWSGQRVLLGEDGIFRGLSIVSTAGILVGIPYLGWFIRKARKLP